MDKLTKEEIEGIKQFVEKEFPDDPALQQVHIARKVLTREAERQGLSFLQYIKSIRQKDRSIVQGN